MHGLKDFRYDRVSRLAKAEISITGATTATIGRMHVCTGTTADYTVTLPAGSGLTAGDMLCIRMAPALTKLVTIDGNGAETIDGATTRVMWSREVALLQWNGTEWNKIDGVSREMTGMIFRNSNQTSIANGSSVTVLLNTSKRDNFGTMVDTANNRLVIRRANKYLITAQVRFEFSGAAVPRAIGGVYYNGSTSNQITAFETCNVQIGGFPSCPFAIEHELVVSDTLQLYGFQNAAGGVTANQNIVGDANIMYTFLCATEKGIW